MLAAVAMLGVFVMLVVFALALGVWVARPPAEEVKAPAVAVIPSRFFAVGAVGQRQVAEVPIDVFLSQLESHIRLEQAAAENFLYQPSSERLHAPTTSPLSN